VSVQLSVFLCVCDRLARQWCNGHVIDFLIYFQSVFSCLLIFCLFLIFLSVVCQHMLLCLAVCLAIDWFFWWSFVYCLRFFMHFVVSHSVMIEWLFFVSKLQMLSLICWSCKNVIKFHFLEKRYKQFLFLFCRRYWSSFCSDVGIRTTRSWELGLQCAMAAANLRR